MKLFIPFNSNDFNNVFSTLTISPWCFYTERGYGYKRSSKVALSPFDSVLVGYEMPVMTTNASDVDGGVQVLLGVQLNADLISREETVEGIRLFMIDKTIYLFDDFELLFRTTKEKDAVFAGTLKSLETKYTDRARAFSRVPEEKEWKMVSPDSLTLIKGDFDEMQQPNFLWERVVNRVAGAVLGFAVGRSTNIGQETRKVQLQSKELNNLVALYVNSLSSSGGGSAKARLMDCLANLKTQLNSIESVEESFVLGSRNLKPQDIERDCNQDYLEFNKFELIIEGLLALDAKGLPMPLKVEKAIRIVRGRYNSKYPDSYVKRLWSAIDDVQLGINEVTDGQSPIAALSSEAMPKVMLEGEGASISMSGEVRDADLLELTLGFFIRRDGLSHPDEFFAIRRDLLIAYGQFLRNNFVGWDDSEARKYIGRLLNSFESLKNEFDITSSKSDVMRSLGVLFTVGRDLSLFLDAILAAGVEQREIPIAIWGATYGAATMPKTLTDCVLNRKESLKLYLEELRGVVVSSSGISCFVTERGDFLEVEQKFDVIQVSMFEDEIVANAEGSWTVMEFQDALSQNKQFERGSPFWKAACDTAEHVKSSVPEIEGSCNELFIVKFRDELLQRAKSVSGLGPKRVEIAVSIFSGFIEKY